MNCALIGFDLYALPIMVVFRVRFREKASGAKCVSRLLASVNIFVDPSEKDSVVASLLKLDKLEEIYEVTGDCDIVSVISASSLEEFREVLHKKIMKIKGVKSTITAVILKRHKHPKERDVSTRI